eukprot:GHVU01200094.1.p1 GENE.GHVU01200094.1~~GHVU01200094.1.p1  ORF type:complete len:349 (-),score=34.36 GHVU01200094.1:820-1866(-)
MYSRARIRATFAFVSLWRGWAGVRGPLGFMCAHPGPRISHTRSDRTICAGFTDRFWATFWAMHEFLRDIHELQQELQHKWILFPQQEEAFRNALHRLTTKGCLYAGPCEQERRCRQAGDDIFVVGTVIANPGKLLRNADGMSTQFKAALRTLGEDERADTAYAVSRVFATAAAHVQDILSDYDKMDMPPVQPGVYRDMDPDEFSQLLQKYEVRHRHRLRNSGVNAYEEWVAAVKEERANMPACASAPRRWPKHKTRDEKMVPPPTMADLWRGLTDLCPKLFQLAGGFSTAYPTTVDVERHFSRMAHIRNKWRNRMRPWALDGCFHCQQLRELEGIATWLNPEAATAVL